MRVKKMRSISMVYEQIRQMSRHIEILMILCLLTQLRKWGDTQIMGILSHI